MEAKRRGRGRGRGRGENSHRFSPNFVSMGGLQERRLQEEKGMDFPLFPSNYVTLKQLQERRLKEASCENSSLQSNKEKEKGKRPSVQPIESKNGGGRERKRGNDSPSLPPNFVSLRDLRERWLREKKGRSGENSSLQSNNEEKEKEREKGKSPFTHQLESENEDGGEGKRENNSPHLPPNYVSLRDLRERKLREERELNSSHFPPNYVTLKMLKEQKLKEANGENSSLQSNKEKEKAKSPYVRPLESEKGKGGNDSSLFPPNYVTLRQLRDLRLKEQQQREEKADEVRRLKTEAEKKIANPSRDQQSKILFKDGCVKTGFTLVWRPVSALSDTSLAGAVPVPAPVPVPMQDKGGTAGEILTVSAEETKKNRKKEKKKRISKKKYGEGLRISEKLLELTGSENGNAEKKRDGKAEGKKVILPESSNKKIVVGKMMKASEIESSLKEKGKGKMVQLPEPSAQTAKEQRLKESMNGSEIENGSREKGKGKMVQLPEPTAQTAKEQRLKESMNGSEIENGSREKGKGKGKGKGKMVNMQESRDQTVKGTEIKNVVGEKGKGKMVNVHISGDQTAEGSEIKNVMEEKGKGKMANVTESRDQTVIVDGRRKWTTEKRGWRDPRVRSFTAGGGLVWVPKNSS